MHIVTMAALSLYLGQPALAADLRQDLRKRYGHPAAVYQVDRCTELKVLVDERGAVCQLELVRDLMCMGQVPPAIERDACCERSLKAIAEELVPLRERGKSLRRTGDAGDCRGSELEEFESVIVIESSEVCSILVSRLTLTYKRAVCGQLIPASSPAQDRFTRLWPELSR